MNPGFSTCRHTRAVLISPGTADAPFISDLLSLLSYRQVPAMSELRSMVLLPLSPLSPPSLNPSDTPIQSFLVGAPLKDRMLSTWLADFLLSCDGGDKGAGPLGEGRSALRRGTPTGREASACGRRSRLLACPTPGPGRLPLCQGAPPAPFLTRLHGQSQGREVS